MNLEEQNFIRNNLVDFPPIPCDLKVGDVVTFTNSNGVSFEGKVITGFSKPENMFNDRFIHLNGDAYWFPKKRSELKLEQCSK